MGSSIFLPSKRSACRAAVLLLLALVSFALGVEGSQPIHSHEDGELGLYNAECPLAVLAAVHTTGALPAAPASAWIALIGLGTIVAGSSRIASALPSFASPRAPPLV
jgi:hypothetical protein